MSGHGGRSLFSTSNARSNSLTLYTALTTSLLVVSTTLANAENASAVEDVTLSELSVTGNGPAVERAVAR